MSKRPSAHKMLHKAWRRYVRALKLWALPWLLAGALALGVALGLGLGWLVWRTA